MGGSRGCYTEWSQTEKEKYHMISYICRIFTNQWCKGTYLQNRNRLIDWREGICASCLASTALLLHFYSRQSNTSQLFLIETVLDYGYIWLHIHCLHHVTPTPNIQFHLFSTCDLKQHVSSLSIGFPVHIMGLNSTTQPTVARAMYVKALCKLTACIELPRWCSW